MTHEEFDGHFQDLEGCHRNSRDIDLSLHIEVFRNKIGSNGRIQTPVVGVIKEKPRVIWWRCFS